MSFLRWVTRYVRWYYVVGALLGLTVVAGLAWWLIEHDRDSSFRWGDETDLVEE